MGDDNLDIFLEIQKKIEEYQNIIIFHHIRPDGDCLGSQFGLKELIKDNFNNKNVFTIGNKENLFEFLEMEMDKIPNDDILKTALGIVVDANYLDRIQESQLIKDHKLKEIIRIDHHPVDDDLNASIVFRDASYIASSEQIGDIAISLNWHISSKAAQYIYLGICTDSARFLFKNTSSRTLKIGAKLIETNFDLDKFYLNLYQKTLVDINYSKVIFNNYKTFNNIIYFVADDKLLKDNNFDYSIANQVNILSNIEKFYIWIFFIEEKEENVIRVRLRSMGPNVSEVAKKFNGGGHFRASGAIIKSFDEIKLVLQYCDEEIAKWLKTQNQ